MNVWFAEVQIPADVAAEITLIDARMQPTEVDPSWVPVVGSNRLAVSSPDWDQLGAPHIVREKARRLVGKINSQLHADSALQEHIQLGAYVWQRDGSIATGFRRHAFVEAPAVAIGLSTGSAATLIDGIVVPPPRTLGYRTNELKARDSDFARALELFTSTDDDIRKLWVVYEYVRDHFSRTVFMGLGGTDQSSHGSFCETANYREFRHKSRAVDLAYPEMSGNSATAFVRTLLRGWVDTSNPR